MRIQLSDHFNYGKLLRFTLPSVGTMVFASVYSMVDGFFVSNYVSKTAFSAVNLMWPIIAIPGAVGMMLGTGGNAVVGKTLGENKQSEAVKYFSMIVYSILVLGIIIGALGFFLAEPLSRALGAENELLENCIIYIRYICLGAPFFMLQYSVQGFFTTAEKPKLGFFVTSLGGITNIFLDYLFIARWKMGIAGAALATVAGQILAAAIALIYFSVPNKSLLRLTLKTKLYGNILAKACFNGSSEMMVNLAYSIVSILYNFQLLKYYGEDGVAVYGILMYVGFIFSAIYSGYSMGISPVVSYNLGAQNHIEMKNLFRKSLFFISLMGLAMAVIAQVSAPAISAIFVGYDKNLHDLTCYALRIYAISFLFMGVAIFGSAFFTALNDGIVSAKISFVRTFVFEIGAILLIPVLFGAKAIWWSVATAEFASFVLTLLFFAKYRKKYHYA